MDRKTPFTIALAMTASLAHAGDTHGHDHDHGHGAHVFELDGLEVVHPWTPATDSSTAYVYMEILNESSAAIDILGAESDLAERVELVGFTIAGGQQTATPLPSVPVAPGRELELAPDLMAIRLTGLSASLLQGDHAEIHLLTSIGELEIDVAVEAANARHHSHAGHSH